ncbi:MAG: carbohydrate ABC transporter permease [Vicinamibacterales bacterium]
MRALARPFRRGRSGGGPSATVLGLAPVVLIVVVLAPVYWMLAASFMPETQLFERPSLVPWPPTMTHYRELFDVRQFWLPMRNSFIVATATTVATVPLAALAAYALARLRFRGRTTLLALVLAVAMFPQIALVSPLFIGLRALGLIDTFPGLVAPYLTFALPLAIWLLVGFFRQLPRELEEAARLDGASRLRTLFEIVAPLAAPGLATTAILTFLYCWNEFLFALSFTLGPEHHTVPVAITLFRGQYQVPWGQILAAAVVATVPVIAIVLVFQRRIVQGLTAGALKG